MNPTDIRNDTFHTQSAQWPRLRRDVWHALRACREPIDTLTLSERCGISLLSVRPRVSALCQLGFVACVGRNERGGLYVARSDAEIEAAHRGETPYRQQDLI